MRAEDCVQTRVFKPSKMTIKLCSMLDTCDCGNLDCCAKKKDDEYLKHGKKNYEC